MEIPEQDMLKTKLLELQKQQRNIQGQALEVQREKIPIENYIKSLEKQLALLNKQEYIFDKQLDEVEYQISNQHKEIWWQSNQFDLRQVTISHLPSLPTSVLDQIVKMKYNVDKLVFHSSMGTELGRHVLVLSQKEYEQAVINRITSHESCRYCRSIFHMISVCPEIQKKVCTMCGENGHSKFHCTKQVKDLYRSKPHRR
jgi:hypothetical protein